MKVIWGAALTAALASGFTQPAAAKKKFSFKLVSSSSTCVPKAAGRVKITPVGANQKLQVKVWNLPKNTDFDLFVIQVPGAPFGLSWYQGDIETNRKGRGTGEFIGIFSKETFTVAPGVAPAPVVFDDNADSNPATAPVQMYHLGLWFNSPEDAAKAGCPDLVTPFNGEHNAGVQVLNTSNFPDLKGPLRRIK